MLNILLDYFFPITTINPIPAASTAFLKQVLVVVKPKAEVPTGVITMCTSNSAVAALTDNVEAQQLFAAGMNRVFVLPMDGLDLADALEGHESDFFTILISSDFSDAEVLEGTQVTVEEVKASAKIQDILYTAKPHGVLGNDITVSYIEDEASGDEAIVSVLSNAITVDIDASATTADTIAAALTLSSAASALVSFEVDDGDGDDIQSVTGDPVALSGGIDQETDAGSGLDVGAFKGVVGLHSDSESFLAAQAVIENRCAFYGSSINKAKNMFFAFGKLLSNPLNWLNQQYISMPFADDVNNLGDSNNLFDDKISFVLDDAEFGKRLALFACGGRAIVAPYILRNLEIDLQSRALTWVSANQPNYTKVNAALLEDELDQVIQRYLERQWIENGNSEVKLEQSNFVASGYINVSEPRALWRIFGEVRQTL